MFRQSCFVTERTDMMNIGRFLLWAVLASGGGVYTLRGVWCS